MTEAAEAVSEGGVWVADKDGLGKIQGFSVVPFLEFIRGVDDFIVDGIWRLRLRGRSLGCIVFLAAHFWREMENGETVV